MLVIAAIEGAMIVVGTVLILGEARTYRAPAKHVWLISFSYVMLVGIAVNHVRDGRGGWTVLVALTVGIAALACMGWYYLPARRSVRHRRRAEVAAARLMEREKKADELRRPEDDLR